jgi:hypothetical protein
LKNEINSKYKVAIENFYSQAENDNKGIFSEKEFLPKWISHTSHKNFRLDTGPDILAKLNSLLNPKTHLQIQFYGENSNV